MARSGERSRIVEELVRLIRANPNLDDDALALQIDGVYRSGYLAGRRVQIRADLVAKGVASLKRMRQKVRTHNLAQKCASVSIGTKNETVTDS